MTQAPHYRAALHYQIQMMLLFIQACLYIFKIPVFVTSKKLSCTLAVISTDSLLSGISASEVLPFSENILPSFLMFTLCQN